MTVASLKKRALRRIQQKPEKLRLLLWNRYLSWVSTSCEWQTKNLNSTEFLEPKTLTWEKASSYVHSDGEWAIKLSKVLSESHNWLTNLRNVVSASGVQFMLLIVFRKKVWIFLHIKHIKKFSEKFARIKKYVFFNRTLSDHRFLNKLLFCCKIGSKNLKLKTFSFSASNFWKWN